MAEVREIADQEVPPERAQACLSRALALAVAIRELHRDGRLHLSVLDAAPAFDEQRRLPSGPDGPQSFGGPQADRNRCPPELAFGPEVVLETSLAGCRAEFKRLQVPAAPERVDVYQWGAWLCQSLTGQGVPAYLASPRVAARVPHEFRSLLDGALGFSSGQRFGSFDDVVSGIAALSPSGVVRREADTPAVADADTAPTVAAGGVPAHETTSHREHRAAPVESVRFSKLGPFEVLGRIGQGGMGDVYEGRDSQLDRRVAIKVLPSDLAAEPEFVRRFRAEASAAAQLDHPHVVHIYFIGEDQGHHFFAMQFVEGESLASVLNRRGRLSVEETLNLVRQCLLGLQAAHARGLVHRDIKPANILIDRHSGRAIVADFGLVKSLGTPESHRTATGVIMGTVDYIAPEQARGLDVDARSDLYSLGVLMYRMLAGRLPFQADSPTAMIFQHVYEEPLPLCDAAPDVPARLGTLVGNLLAKSPDARPSSSEQVLRELANLDHEPVDGSLATANLLTPESRETGWMMRARDLARTMFRRHAPEVLQEWQNTQQHLDRAVDLHERRRRQLQKLVDEAERIARELSTQADEHRSAAEAFQRRAAADSHLALDLEQSAREAREQAAELDRQRALQDEEAARLKVNLAKVAATAEQLRAQRNVLVARLKAAGVGGPRPSNRRGLVIASVLMSIALGIAVVVVIVERSGFPSGVLQPPSPVESSAVPESEVSARTKGVGVPETVAGTLWAVRLPARATALGLAPRMRTTGNWFAVGMRDGAVALFRIANERVSFVEQWRVPAEVTAVAVSPDGQRVATGSADKLVRVWMVGQSTPLQEFPGHTEAVGVVSFSPDGLAMYSGGGSVKVWDLQALRESDSVKHPQWSGSEIVIDRSPTSTGILVGYRQSGAESLYVLDPAEPGKPLTLDTGKQRTVRAVFAPDGQHVWGVLWHALRVWNISEGTSRTLASGQSLVGDVSRAAARAVTADGSTLTVWDLWRGTAQQTLTLGHIPDQIALAPDGRVAVTADRNGFLTVVDLPEVGVPEGQVVTFQKDEPVRALTMSADGRLVATATGTTVDLLLRATGKRTAGYSIGDAVTALAMTPDSQRLLYGAGLSRSAAGVRVITTDPTASVQAVFRDLRRVTGHRAEITALVPLDRGRGLLTASRDGSLRVWELQSESEKHSHDLAAPINAVAVLPGETRVVVATDDPMVVVWDLVEKRRAAEWDGHTSAVTGVAISADGLRVATAGSEGNILIRNAETGETAKSLTGHSGRVNAVTLSRDGALAVSGGNDATVRVWNAVDGSLLQTLHGHSGPVTAVVVSADGSTAVSGSQDGSTRVWSLTPNTGESP